MDRRKRIRGILRYTGLILICLVLIYVGLDAPTFTAEMAMHRQEAMHWVGPSKVIAAGDVNDMHYDHILLGETEHGYCLYEYTDGLWNRDTGSLTYIAKDDKRVCFIPDRYTDVDFEKILPVFAISGNSRAVSARLTLETVSDKDPVYCGTVTAQAQLRQGCWFLFETDLSEVWIDVARYWNLRLKGNQWSYGYIMGSATLELFDGDGNLIETRVTEFPANT